MKKHANAEKLCYTYGMTRAKSQHEDLVKFKVAIIDQRHNRASLDRVSGIIRCLAQRTDVRIVNPEDPIFAGLAELKMAVAGVRIPRRAGDTPKPKVVTFERFVGGGAIRHPDIYHDDSTSARAAAELLIRRGHVNFAFIGSDIVTERRRSNIRAKAFADFLASKGLSCRIYHAPADAKTRYELVELADFLRMLPKPCGVMLFADRRAQATLDACRYARISVPEQVALIGVDNDTNICENMQPTLSSVQPNFEQAGYLGAELLLKMLDGERIRPKTAIPVGVRSVRERDSTQDLRCGGLLVTRVDDYLRKNFMRKLNVSEIAQRFNVSRRLVELRFREIRGCSVLERLTALRIAEAKHKLETTTIPVGEIGEICGYRSFRAFCYAFASATGTTPRNYRNSSP